MTFIQRRSPVRRNELTNLFDEFFNDWGVSEAKKNRVEGFSPAINLKENNENYILEAELAGLKKEDIDISVKDKAIHLKGEKKTFHEEEKENFHHVERSYGSFYRTIPLGSDADVERVKANFEDGLLTIEVAKHTGPEKGHRKIDIL